MPHTCRWLGISLCRGEYDAGNYKRGIPMGAAQEGRPSVSVFAAAAALELLELLAAAGGPALVDTCPVSAVLAG